LVCSSRPAFIGAGRLDPIYEKKLFEINTKACQECEAN